MPKWFMITIPILIGLAIGFMSGALITKTDRDAFETELAKSEQMISTLQHQNAELKSENQIILKESEEFQEEVKKLIHLIKTNGVESLETNPEDVPPQDQPEPMPVSPRQEKNIPIYKINQTFNVGYWQYCIHGCEWKDFIYDGVKQQKPDGKYLVVHLTIKNCDSSASKVPQIILIDENYARYDATTLLVPKEISVLFDEINPGISKTGKIIFDIPRQHWYSVLVSGGWESDEIAMVTLY